MQNNHLSVTKHYRQIIQAAPAKVFPLLCPVREKEWLENWEYQMLYSVSGLAEAGCVFSTPEGDTTAIWLIILHDERAGRISFVKTVPDISITRLDIHVAPIENRSQSHVDITYCHTGLSARGDKIIQGITDGMFNKRLKFWEDAMNHYLETGSQLQSTE